ncbi:hypothetical protein ACFXAZ_16505 [Streptomyces sp. NPDC059477]|uniref:hypothetical protein n=1 Tax=Streptomyces sp. NPDC059477 TaxID=3346847 RepID=UPI00369AB789
MDSGTDHLYTRGAIDVVEILKFVGIEVPRAPKVRNSVRKAILLPGLASQAAISGMYYFATIAVHACTGTALATMHLTVENWSTPGPHTVIHNATEPDQDETPSTQKGRPSLRDTPSDQHVSDLRRRWDSNPR